ncbi:MAG: 30S ribosomal protein S16 [Mariniphaga sp.]
MSVKIRLARHGRKQHAYYHIVVSNSRSPRDGRFIERIGSYNPNTNPATIDLDFDKAIEWLNNGAQPTDTCRTILSHKGVMMKKHLLEGVKKGAFDLAEAEVRFGAWLKEKENAVQSKKDGLVAGFNEELKKRFSAESKINETRIAEIAKKNAAFMAASIAKSTPPPVVEVVPVEVVAAEVVAAEVVAAEVVAAEVVVAEVAVAEVVAAEVAVAEVEVAEVVSLPAVEITEVSEASEPTTEAV